MPSPFVAQARQWLSDFFGLRWVRFGIVGAISTAIYAGLGIAFDWWKWPVLVGNATAYVLSFVFSYLAQRKWTFRSNLPHAQLLPKYAALQAAGLGLNTAIIVVLMYVGLPYVVSMSVAIVLVPFFVYIVNKLWVFRTPKTSSPSAPE
ncbi:MAG: GtrA family protein [Desulfovibrionaceae bacterium]